MSRRTAESSKAILAAWTKEQELVKVGKGTRDWTPQQQQDILERGKAYDDNGKAFEGQHMKSAEVYPEYQGAPGNIQFLTRVEHLEAHDGSWQNPTNWYFNPVIKEKIDFGDGPFIPCEVIQLSAPIIALMDNSTIKEIFVEEKEDSSKADVLKQSIGLRRKTYGKLEQAKTHTVQIEIPKKSNKALVEGIKLVGRFIVKHPVKSLEIVGLTIGCVVNAVDSIKGRGSGSTHRAVSNSENLSVVDKIVDIAEKASGSLIRENDVKGHKQRYHRKSGVVWKDKAPYRRGGK